MNLIKRITDKLCRKPLLVKPVDMPSLLADRWDAENFLIEKGISNHPIVSECNNKESYEVADLMAEFANNYYGNERAGNVDINQFSKNEQKKEFCPTCKKLNSPYCSDRWHLQPENIH